MAPAADCSCTTTLPRSAAAGQTGAHAEPSPRYNRQTEGRTSNYREAWSLSRLQLQPGIMATCRRFWLPREGKGAEEGSRRRCVDACVGWMERCMNRVGKLPEAAIRVFLPSTQTTGQTQSTAVTPPVKPVAISAEQRRATAGIGHWRIEMHTTTQRSRQPLISRQCPASETV
jgi:hypothetical protein